VALYRRSSPQESRAADKVYELISTHRNGVTFYDLMQDHPNEISDNSSVLAAIDLLREEGKVFSIEPWEGLGYLNQVKLFANALTPNT
jgi:hypothetical protein